MSLLAFNKSDGLIERIDCLEWHKLAGEMLPSKLPQPHKILLAFAST
jgi:hypothetical protein